ncbi:MAG: sensor histidine kinase [Chloroflexota bacterium]
MDRAQSPWGVLTVGVLVLSIGVLIVFIGARLAIPGEQAFVSIDQWDWSSDGATVRSVAGEALPPDRRLRDGDVVAVINGRSLQSWADNASRPFDPDAAAPDADRGLRIGVIRAGTPAVVEITPGPFPVGRILAEGWPLLAFAGLMVAVSAFIAVRRPELIVARVLLVGAVGNLASALPWQLGLVPTDLVRAGPPLVAFMLTGPINLLFWSATLHIVLVFETRAGTEHRRRLLTLAWLGPQVALGIGVVATRLATGSTLAWIDTWAPVQSAVVAVVLTLAVIGTVGAYRRAHPALRHDVRWIALAFGAAALATLGLVILPVVLTGHPIAPRPVLALLAIPIPVALAVAVLRDRLFEIDILRQSREALVVAREDERRRLRRDLHDGLGPSLAAITVKLGVARRQIRDDPARAEALVDEVTSEAQAAIAEVRRMASELRPPALDEVGLVEAIRRRADGFAVEHIDAAGVPPRIEVVGPVTLPTIGAAAEVAAYRIAVEAMTNVVRHAAASRCQVTISIDDDIRLEIVDDGVGLRPGWRMGVGTASMRERATELGGVCTVESGDAGGTRVDAHIPLGAG